MYPQDQVNFDEDDDDDSSSSMDDVDLALNPHDADDPAGSSKKVVVKFKNYLMPENSAADPPSPPPPPPPPPAGEIKSHHCRECNKSFSSGKALGGHMSSAHVQANKDYSFKKQQKPRANNTSYYPGSGSNNDILCKYCCKSFTSQKSLYGHMRCHPDRDYRGMVEPKMGSSSTDHHPGFRYAEDDDPPAADSGPDHHPPPPAAPLANFLKAWPVTAKRGRSAKPGTVSPPDTSSEEEGEIREITAGHQLLRLLDRKPDPGVKIGQARESANHGPGQASREWDEARDNKRQKGSPKLKIWNTNGRIEEDYSGKGKDKMVEEEEDGPESESEDELLLGAISVLVNGKREQNGRPVTESSNSPLVPKPSKTVSNGESCSLSPGEKLVSPPRKENSGLTSSSSEKYVCCTCKKVFPSHQALGGHRSSHKKLTVSIFNTADENSGGSGEKKPKTKNVVVNGGDQENEYPCKVCGKVFQTGRALGGHKKCHNNNNSNSNNNNNNNNNTSNSGSIVGDVDHVGNDKEKESGEKEKVVRGFDLNLMPEDENEPDGDFAGF